ncbi:MAG: tetratricopeptide repeat protein [Phycisphaerae bacterium]|nr:tetratricopeptide repeat protein [Phycisphaerae bacterium]
MRTILALTVGRFGLVLLCGVLLASVTVPSLAQPATSAPTAPRPATDARPRVAVIGFEPDPAGDARDTWIPVALEELLARRLQRVPNLVIVPTLRLYQARSELGDPNAPPPWPDIVRGLGAGYILSGRCQGPDNAITLELTLQPLAEGAAGWQTTIPAARLFEMLDLATRWTLERFELTLDDATRTVVLATPSRTPTAVEYYARALMATRADQSRDALRFATLALDRDKRFRPALALLAQLEMPLGPSGRGSAGRRFRALSDLARLENDPFDRVRAEIGQALLLQADDASDAAYTRAETALALAYECRDVYGQMAAVTAICDAYLLRALPINGTSSEADREAHTRTCVQRAIEWQILLVDLLTELGDQIACLPATNKLALLYERVGDTARALELHRRTLALAEQLQSRRHQATAWLYIGEWHRVQKQWPEALAAITRCLALADEAAKPPVRIILGGVYQGMGQREEALAQFELAYEQVRKTDDLGSQFACLRQIASAHMQLGRRDKAIAALQEAIDIAHVLELREEQDLRTELHKWQDGGT